jgi:hypothetical protein
MSPDATLNEIYHEGLDALRERLGPAGMIRFLQMFDTGRGDYAKERHEWVDRTTLDDVRAASSLSRKTRRRRGKK